MGSDSTYRHGAFGLLEVDGPYGSHTHTYDARGLLRTTEKKRGGEAYATTRQVWSEDAALLTTHDGATVYHDESDCLSRLRREAPMAVYDPERPRHWWRSGELQPADARMQVVRDLYDRVALQCREPLPWREHVPRIP